MKEIEEYIKSNTELYEKTKKEYEQTESDYEKLRLKNLMDCYKYYVMGLQDAVKYLEKEKNESEGK